MLKCKQRTTPHEVEEKERLGNYPRLSGVGIYLFFGGLVALAPGLPTAFAGKSFFETLSPKCQDIWLVACLQQLHYVL